MKAARVQRKVQVWVVFRGPTGVTVLILKTRAERGSFWQPITGGVELRETSIEAARREAFEETGLLLLPRPRALGCSFRYHSRWGHAVVERGYWIELRGVHCSGGLPVLQIDKNEHIGYQWVSAAAARRKIRFKSNQKLLDLVLQKIKTNLKGNPCYNSPKSLKKNWATAPVSMPSLKRRSAK